MSSAELVDVCKNAEALKGFSFSYECVRAHLSTWINEFNQENDDSICFIDCALSDFEQNLSFSLELSPRGDESREYRTSVEKYLNDGFTVGGHCLFKMGLPKYNDPRRIETKKDFDALTKTTGYQVGYLLCETTVDNLTQPGSTITVQRGAASDILVRISPPDDLSLYTAFEKFVADCCKNRHDRRGKGLKYVFGIPICRLPLREKPEENDLCASVFLGVSSAVEKSSANRCAIGVIKFFNETILPVFSKIKMAIEQTKSAIGSIMSRNGSHNIGSHVLSALSHNIGTMPDDRVLYQYLQQRMDYTATVTTDFPNWTAPTRFVGNLMKTFFSQRHLLEHISESEGLGAYHFRGRHIAAQQKAKIKLHLRRFELDDVSGALQKKLEEIEAKDSSSVTEEIRSPGLDEIVIDPKNIELLWNILSKARIHPPWLEKLTAIIKHVSEQKKDPFEFPSVDEIPLDSTNTAWLVKKLSELKNAMQGASGLPPETQAALRDFIERCEQKINSWRSQVIWRAVYDKANHSDKWVEFTVYPDEAVKKFTSLLKDDVTLGIPGGVVGQHAFYTIIENIIRNAAKHDWTRSDHSANLDVFIDFIDLKNDARVEFTIWSACGNLVINEDMKEPLSAAKVKEFADMLTTKDREKATEDMAAFDNLPLHHQLQVRLAQPLIDDNGTRRENWGLAEMKISAGYLQRRSVGQIGSLEDLKEGDHIILPVAVPDPEHENQYHLGYRFHVPKSRKILIVLKEDEAKKPKNADALMDDGIFFKTEEEVEKEKDAEGHIELAYEYVVLPEKKDAHPDWLLPFRVLDSESEIEYKTLITLTDPVEIKKAVYAAWMKGLKGKSLPDKDRGNVLYLQVQAQGASGGGKALVSDLDLYRVVFRECGHSVLMEAVGGQKSKTVKLLTTLLALTPLGDLSLFPAEKGAESRDYIRERLRDFCGLFERELSLSRAFKDRLRKIYLDPTQMINGEGITGFEQAFLRNVQLDLQSGGNFVRTCVGDLVHYLDEVDPRRFGDELEVFCGRREGVPPAFFDRGHGGIYDDDDDEEPMLRRNIARLLVPADSEMSEEFAKLVEKLNSAYLTSEIFLRKYEENISTLPSFYKEKPGQGGNGGGAAQPENNPFPGIVEPYSPTGSAPVISYVRHDNARDGLYAEALSGSQSYLNALANFSWSPPPSGTDPRPELIVRLVENALLRVLIIDERVCNFLKVRPKELEACRKMRIFAVDVDKQGPFNTADDTGFVTVVKPHPGELAQNECFGIEAGKFDVLILHQGIIDKWVSKHDPEKVGNLLEAFEKVIPYVVVTTGRGRPDNIPPNARVLPFSTIESTLFRKYPEKLVLVNTVMNILPAKPKKDPKTGAAQTPEQNGAES